MNTETQAKRRKIKAIKIGEMCQFYRKKENLTVREIASKTGYLPQTVYAFENGRSNASIILFDCYFNQLSKQHQMELFNKIKGLLR